MDQSIPNLMVKKMKLLDTLKPSIAYLEKANIDEPVIEAGMLLLHVSGLDRLTAYRDNPEVGPEILSEIHKLIGRRAMGEPMQYITGEVDFLDLVIKVGRGVLIPRPETEILARETIKEARGLKSVAQGLRQTAERRTPNFEQYSSLRILDLCSGSGCIALALAREFPDANIHGIDISGTAVKYAETNAAFNKISNVIFLEGSLFGPVTTMPVFDLIVSNPPYIRTSEIGTLQREVREWEPLEALDGGMDGLDFYRKILLGARSHLSKGGKILLEAGYDQAGDIAVIAEKSGFKNITLIKDFSGIERILKAEAPA
ncbi:MAG: peptide chain release factor N(5)-glutamine methyltransferase [Nitrospirota bacterium]|nr:peptide chain release factor N(5)-glutamine methyltransferase [Nitrospirota bacterium]